MQLQSEMDWNEAYYDATKQNGSRLYIQAEIPWYADLSWIQATKEFAKQHSHFRNLLETSRGELKSQLYFEILEDPITKSYSSLLERMRDGPREAIVYLYDLDHFRSRSMEKLNVKQEETQRDEVIRRSVRELAATEVIRSSPISNLQTRLKRLGLRNYSPILDSASFKAETIAKDFRYLFAHVAIVAARTHAVFGSLAEIETDPAQGAAVATQKINELLRMDRAFDKDLEKSISVVLLGIYELELGTDAWLTGRGANIREEPSEKFEGIQGADIASAVARKLLEDVGNEELKEENLGALLLYFNRVFLNGTEL